jgi:hypothetical protein
VSKEKKKKKLARLDDGGEKKEGAAEKKSHQIGREQKQAHASAGYPAGRLCHRKREPFRLDLREKLIE